MNRPYESGDIMSCFFAVVFGIFAIGQVTPNIKALAEGRAAAKSAFSVIDRIPVINSNDISKTKTPLKG